MNLDLIHPLIPSGPSAKIRSSPGDQLGGVALLAGQVLIQPADVVGVALSGSVDEVAGESGEVSFP